MTPGDQHEPPPTPDEAAALAFANGVGAAGGGRVDDPESDADLLAAVRGEISFDEAVERSYRRIMSRPPRTRG